MAGTDGGWRAQVPEGDEGGTGRMKYWYCPHRRLYGAHQVQVRGKGRLQIRKRGNSLVAGSVASHLSSQWGAFFPNVPRRRDESTVYFLKRRGMRQRQRVTGPLHQRHEFASPTRPARCRRLPVFSRASHTQSAMDGRTVRTVHGCCAVMCGVQRGAKPSWARDKHSSHNVHGGIGRIRSVSTSRPEQADISWYT
ncbi:hypothetical protein DM02DRAFT_725257 [Periconia macrospinosa]|uniref:Uncharacterized protein n=1 Tax=Periconia macrospinosa TaxID=97972 RepID=A0A2V1E491_9PLEO|nr:hypothetical protein DM02DRAFT_725257 [Periconia macrospinosa]